MRAILLTSILLIAIDLLGQNCQCKADTSLVDIVHCDTIHFSNNSMLYWNYNCDSSWLTFRNRLGKKVVLYTLEGGLMSSTERLGYLYATEYKKNFLIQNNVISGCCDPPEFILFDKETGNEKLNLGRLIFYSETLRHPVVAYFENSNYNSSHGDKIDFNNVTLRNVDKNTVYKIRLPTNRLETAIKLGDELYPEHLIDQSEIINGKLFIKYRYKTKDANAKWLSGKIIIDLMKYGS